MMLRPKGHEASQKNKNIRLPGESLKTYMKLRGKQKWIYKLISESGSRGINTNSLRSITHAVDVPKIVSILNEKGKDISSTRESDGTATYRLTYLPKRPIYQYKGNVARIVGYR